MNGTLTAPEFRRLLELRGEDAVVVDLVRDYAVRVVPEKLVLGKVRVDAVEEIFANKVCALLSPAEIRDLVDGIALNAAGHDLQVAIQAAMLKDRGLTRARLGVGTRPDQYWR